MNNNKRKISAGEINKFTYCPYQWYYVRMYGTKELRELNGSSEHKNEHFVKGNKFHNRYHFFYKCKVFLVKIFMLLLFSGICFAVYYFIKFYLNK